MYRRYPKDTKPKPNVNQINTLLKSYERSAKDGVNKNKSVWTSYSLIRFKNLFADFIQISDIRFHSCFYLGKYHYLYVFGHDDKTQPLDRDSICEAIMRRK